MEGKIYSCFEIKLIASITLSNSNVLNNNFQLEMRQKKKFQGEFWFLFYRFWLNVAVIILSSKDVNFSEKRMNQSNLDRNYISTILKICFHQNEIVWIFSYD